MEPHGGLQSQQINISINVVHCLQIASMVKLWFSKPAKVGKKLQRQRLYLCQQQKHHTVLTAWAFSLESLGVSLHSSWRTSSIQKSDYLNTLCQDTQHDQKIARLTLILSQFWPSLSAYCTLDSLCTMATGSGLVEFSMHRNWSALDSRLWFFFKFRIMLPNYGQQNVAWAKWRKVVAAGSTSPFQKRSAIPNGSKKDSKWIQNGSKGTTLIQHCIPRPNSDFSPKRSPQSNCLGSAQRPARKAKSFEETNETMFRMYSAYRCRCYRAFYTLRHVTCC